MLICTGYHSLPPLPFRILTSRTMSTNWQSYPQPSWRLEAPTSNPRQLAQLQTPPANQLLDRLLISKLSPSELAAATPFTNGFSRTKHVIPAAFPRIYNSKTTEGDYPKGSMDESSEERKKRTAMIGKTLLEKRIAIETEKVDPNPQDSPVMLIELERFARIEQNKHGSGKDGLTLVLSHANGFHKEMWDVVIKQMDTQHDCSRIQEIWTYDVFNHGNSGLLNQDLLSDTFDWTDNARDYVNIVAAYLPDRASPGNALLPTVLPRVSEAEVQRRLSSGFSNRTVVGVGHSLGACALARAAAEYAPLWSSIVLVDPAFVPGITPDPSGGIQGLVNGSLSRRSAWSSRAEARELLQTNPFFAAWDPEILSIYVEHGLMDDTQNGGVKLKTSGFQEAVTFCERRTVFETWELLSQIDPKVPIHWMLSGRKPKITGNEEITAQTAWRRGQNCSNIRVPGAGHLVVQEAPKALADGLCNFLETTYGTLHTKGTQVVGARL